MRQTPLIDPDWLAELERDGLWQPQTLWDLARAADPARTAVVCPRNGVIAYGTLVSEAEGLAAAWHEAGLSSGDIVIVQLPNCYEFSLAHLALTRLGAITLPAPIPDRERELEAILTASGACAIVCSPGQRSTPDAAVYQRLRELNDQLRLIVDVDEGRLRAAAVGGDPAQLPAPPDPDEVTIILSTSGTTGVPKLVLHSHRSTVGGVLQSVAAAMGLGSDDVLFMPSPVCHASGLQYGVRFAIALGVPLLLIDRWQANDAVELIEEWGATWSLGATPFVYDLITLPAEQRARLSSLRSFACGGAPIPRSVAEAAAEALPKMALMPVWGMSETGIVTLVRPEDPKIKVATTDGRSVPGWEVRIRTPTGDPVGPNELGEIQCRGSALFQGYMDRPDLTETATGDGWLRTGDLGYLDEDGFMRCKGRIRDVIIRGGVNISAGEVEDVVRHHPAIRDVAIVGVPDPRLGERVGAVVVSAGEVPSVAELDRYLDESGLARNKHPERIVTVDALPMTPAGKVQKHLLAGYFV